MLQEFFANITISTFSATKTYFVKRFRSRHRRRLSWLVLICSGLACRPTMPAATTLPLETDGHHSSALEEPIGLSVDPPPAQNIFPGDLVHLRIMSTEPYEPVEIWVDSTGSLHIPFGGGVTVTGLEITEIEARIEELIRKYDRYARVAITVDSFSGHRVVVSGAVDKPGVYEAKPGVRIADIVASAGGTRVTQGSSGTVDAADIAGARIVRDGKTMPVSVRRALLGEPNHNVYVRPGDIIFIPWMIGRHIAILGDMRSPCNVPYHEGIRLTEVLAAAGGPSRTADTADVRIIRGPLSSPKVYRANLDDLIRGNTTDVVLAPGDVIFVTEHWFATATDVISRVTPLLATATFYATLAR